MAGKRGCAHGSSAFLAHFSVGGHFGAALGRDSYQAEAVSVSAEVDGHPGSKGSMTFELECDGAFRARPCVSHPRFEDVI